jgi:hypothetical protein
VLAVLLLQAVLLSEVPAALSQHQEMLPRHRHHQHVHQAAAPCPMPHCHPIRPPGLPSAAAQLQTTALADHRLVSTHPMLLPVVLTCRCQPAHPHVLHLQHVLLLAVA